MPDFGRPGSCECSSRGCRRMSSSIIKTFLESACVCACGVLHASCSSPACAFISCVVSKRFAILNQPVGTENPGQTQNNVTVEIQHFDTVTFSLWTQNNQDKCWHKSNSRMSHRGTDTQRQQGHLVVRSSLGGDFTIVRPPSATKQHTLWTHVPC